VPLRTFFQEAVKNCVNLSPGEMRELVHISAYKLLCRQTFVAPEDWSGSPEQPPSRSHHCLDAQDFSAQRTIRSNIVCDKYFSEG